MKPKTVDQLPDVWLLVQEGPPGMFSLEGDFARPSDARKAVRQRDEQLRAYKRKGATYRGPQLQIYKDTPRLPLCPKESFIWRATDLTMRENWLARNWPLMGEAERNVLTAIAITYSKGLSTDSLASRACGPAAIPVREGWPSCKRCAGPLWHVGTLDFRHTPLLRCVPGDALSSFFCRACGRAWVSPRLYWRKARRRHRLSTPPNEQKTRSEIGTPWKVRDFDPESLTKFSGLAGIGNTVAGYRIYTWPSVWGDKIGGFPTWIQGDCTPSCRCGEKMRFACQFVARGDDIDFGDSGTDYVFVCSTQRCGETTSIFQEF